MQILKQGSYMNWVWMRTLCLYYTRTNTTKEIMENISKIIGADVADR